MKRRMHLLPFAVFLFILPFPGTVTLRLSALAAGSMVCAWTLHKDGFPHVPARAAILLWVACALLSLVAAVDPGYSLGEIKNEIGYAMATYLGFLTLTRTRADAGFFAIALILGALVLAALASWEYFSATSTMWNERGLAGGSGSYSTYLLALMPALLWAGCTLAHRHRWSVISGLIALQLVIAVWAGQRAFWPVFALQALIALYLLRARGFIAIPVPRLRAIGVAAVILSALAVVGATAKRNTIPLSQDRRLAIWPAVAARILEHPLVGKGFGREVMKKAYPELVSKKYPEVWHAHNLFLNYGMSMGIPGMIALLLLFLALLREFWRLSKADERMTAMAGICGVLLVIGVIARNLTNDFFQRDLALLFWTIAGMLLGYATHATADPKPQECQPGRKHACS